MHVEILLKKLEHCSSHVISKNWDVVRKIVAAISEGARIVSHKVHEYHQYEEFNLGNIATWSTFPDTCVTLDFSNDQFNYPPRHIVCNATIWNGTSLGGYQTTMRFEAKIHLPLKFVLELDGLIEREYNLFLEKKYAEHLQEKKESWKKKLSDKLLFPD